MADALYEQNKIDYKHDKEPIPHDNPLLVKYFYVAGGGSSGPGSSPRRRSWRGPP